MSTVTPPTRPTTGVIDYRSAAPCPAAGGPTEFDVELASERTRWIRRRFLWFCAVNVGMMVLFFGVLAKDIRSAPPLARAFNGLDFLVICGGYIAAFVYVWRVRLPLDRLL